MPVCPRCGHVGASLGAPCPEHPDRRLIADDAVADAKRDPLVGGCVADRFAVVAVAGEGGIGKVYRALDEQTLDRRSVALKLLKRSHVDDAVVRGRFDREARIMASLAHPNLVALYDHGALDDGRLYIAMEFVRGVALDDLISRGDAARLEPAALLGLLLGIAGGLAEAHRHGITHRDLKPSNVLLVDGGEAAASVKVVDFGIARAEPGQSTLTKTGMLFGTPAYMSPEQAMGESEIGPPVDVYAFGVMLYELLAGQRPFTGEQALVLLMAHVNQAPPPLRVPDGRDVPEPLIDLAMRCLAKAPGERPVDGSALVAELEQVAAARRLVPLAPLAALTAASAVAAGGMGLRAASPGVMTTASGLRPASPAVREAASRRAIVLGAAAFVVVGVGIGLIVGLSGGEEASAVAGDSGASSGDGAASARLESTEEPDPEPDRSPEPVPLSPPEGDPPREVRTVDTAALDPVVEPVDSGSAVDDETFDTSVPGTEPPAPADADPGFDTSIPGMDDDDDEVPNTSIPEVPTRDDRRDDDDRDDDDDDDEKSDKKKKSDKSKKDAEKRRKEAEKEREKRKKDEEKEREKRQKDSEKLRKEAEKAQKQIGNKIGDELGKRFKIP